VSLGATNNQDMGYFGAPDTRTVMTAALGGGVVAISRLRTSGPLGFVDDPVREDAVMVAFQHRPLQADLFLDGRHVDVRGHNVENITLYDYRLDWGCAINTAFEATNFYIPRSILNTLSAGGGAIGDLIVKPGVCVDDPVIRSLVRALDAAFIDTHWANGLFLDHIGWAFAAHCAAAYLENGRQTDRRSGGLAPWQERRAKEMIDAQLGGEVRLAELAAACGLSVAHFARAFRKSTSLPPHRWLMQRRIQHAQNVLLTTARSIAEIAIESGFTDQSHFTTAFGRIVGTTPAEWRRNRRH
jgi:AraC family transcriptional regulator